MNYLAKIQLINGFRGIPVFGSSFRSLKNILYSVFQIKTTQVFRQTYTDSPCSKTIRPLSLLRLPSSISGLLTSVSLFHFLQINIPGDMCN